MRRFTRSFRTRKNVRRTSALREQFLRQLEREAAALMQQLSEQFNTTLTAQLAQLASGASTRAPETAGDGFLSTNPRDPNSIGSIGQLLSTGVRYLVSRPRTSRNEVVSSRSADAAAGFRLSQAQLATEMQGLLGKGEKNT